MHALTCSLDRSQRSARLGPRVLEQPLRISKSLKYTALTSTTAFDLCRWRVMREDVVERGAEVRVALVLRKARTFRSVAPNANLVSRDF